MFGWMIAALVLAAASFILAIIQLEWHIWVKNRVGGKKIISSKAISKGLSRMANEIFMANFKPGYIVGIDGGGYTIASMLAQQLHIKNVVPLAMTRSWGAHKVTKTEVDEEEKEHINYIAGKKVLLVDDVSATGHTLKEARKALEKLKPKPTIRIAVLVRPMDSELDAPETSVQREFYDFSAYEVKLKGSPENVKLPWQTFDI